MFVLVDILLFMNIKKPISDCFRFVRSDKNFFFKKKKKKIKKIIIIIIYYYI
jgi:hypothetical protein